MDRNRMALVAAKAEEWASQLIDLGPRNTLLYFKNTKQGSLDLTAAEPVALAELLIGKPTRISDLIADPAARRVPPSPARTPTPCRAPTPGRANQVQRGIGPGPASRFDIYVDRNGNVWGVAKGVNPNDGEFLGNLEDFK